MSLFVLEAYDVNRWSIACCNNDAAERNNATNIYSKYHIVQ